MRIKTISIRLKRDVRHRPYVVSQCECELTAEVDVNEDVNDAVDELRADVVTVIERMVMEEILNYKNRRK